MDPAGSSTNGEYLHEPLLYAVKLTFASQTFLKPSQVGSNRSAASATQLTALRYCR